MYDVTLPSEAGGVARAQSKSSVLQYPALQRSSGQAHVSCLPPLSSRHRGARLGSLYQSGAAKIKVPRVYDRDAMELVLINTAGGLTDGDHMTVSADIEVGAKALITTQASEKIYRARGSLGDSAPSAAMVENRLSVAPGAGLVWLPQETILFDGGALDRSLDVYLGNGARFLAIEPIVFGRTAMGERVRQGIWKDRWRVYRDLEHLIYADQTYLNGAPGHKGDPVVGPDMDPDTDPDLDPTMDQVMDQAAVMNGAVGFASGVFIGPDFQMVHDRLKQLPGIDGVDAGVSRLGNEVVSLRAVAQTGAGLRDWVLQMHAAVTGDGPPRTWNC